MIAHAEHGPVVLVAARRSLVAAWRSLVAAWRGLIAAWRGLIAAGLAVTVGGGARRVASRRLGRALGGHGGGPGRVLLFAAALFTAVRGAAVAARPRR